MRENSSQKLIDLILADLKDKDEVIITREYITDNSPKPNVSLWKIGAWVKVDINRFLSKQKEGYRVDINMHLDGIKKKLKVIKIKI